MTETVNGIERAKRRLHPDAMPTAFRLVKAMAPGTTFTAAELSARIARELMDSPGAHGAVIQMLRGAGFIEFHSYGPKSSGTYPTTPARVWVRTEKDGATS